MEPHLALQVFHAIWQLKLIIEIHGNSLVTVGHIFVLSPCERSA